MTFVGKMLVLINLLMSFIFMAFAIMVFTTREDLRGQLKKATAQVNEAKQKQENLDNAKRMAEEQLTTVKENTDKVKREDEEAIAKLEKRVNDLNTQLTQTKEDATKRLAVSNVATTEQTQRREEINQLRKQNEGLLSEQKVLTAQTVDLQDKLSQTKSQLESVNTRNQQMDSRLRELEGYIVRVQGTLPDETILKAAGQVPPPPEVEGIVTRVGEQGKFIQISLGEDDGIRRGHELEVWRTKPEPKYLGKVKVFTTEATTAVAKPVSVSGLIQENDRVGPRIMTRTN